ncbi:MAG: hypothetical protein EOO46_00150 [Flavobacterium sp.]|nr:MAG: hypothetical protein EOO46_00150 [Flavobacterium sp.]
MNDKRELKGIWFLPHLQEIEVGGTLFYEPGKHIRLELFGDLEQRTDITEYFGGSSKYPVIYGITSKGKKISLFECFGSYSITTNAVPLTNYTASAFLEGSHANSHMEDIFDQIEVDFLQLVRWLGKDAFVCEREMVSPKFYKTAIKYSRDHGFNANYEIETDYELELDLSAIGNKTNGIWTIKNCSKVIITNKNNAVSSWELWRRIEIFRTFLSFGLLQPVPYSFIRLRLKENAEFLDYVYLERGAVSNIRNEGFLYNFSRIESKLPMLLKNWYDSTGDMFPIRVHLLEAILHKPSFRSTDFMTLAFAFEGFYHRFLKQKVSKTGGLLNAVKNIQVIFKDLTFLNKIKVSGDEMNDSRNYYAHLFIKDPTKKILTGIELLKMTEKVKILLILSMLKQMGFEIPEIEKCVHNCDLLKKVNSW